MLPVRVLIVDDSKTIRRMIRFRLQQDPRILVVGEAGNAHEARAAIKDLNPDVLTLDVEMPGMNGLDFLEKLMRLRPMPVIMISSETKAGSDASIEALSLGALECVGKPFGRGLAFEFDRLPDLIFAVSEANPRLKGASMLSSPIGKFAWNGRFVLIGASTGGVDALQTILSAYPENCAPTVIAQHMPEVFLSSFARRLAGMVAPRVLLGYHGLVLSQGMVILAPGKNLSLKLRDDGKIACHLAVPSANRGFRPSVDALFQSALPFAQNVVAVLLTGMGRDGAIGMKNLHNAGAICMAQDQRSSVVYGMPRAAMEIGAADFQFSIDTIPAAILNFCCAPEATLLRHSTSGRVAPLGSPT